MRNELHGGDGEGLNRITLRGQGGMEGLPPEILAALQGQAPQGGGLEGLPPELLAALQGQPPQ
jgi:hypothetical protein